MVMSAGLSTRSTISPGASAFLQGVGAVVATSYPYPIALASAQAVKADPAISTFDPTNTNASITLSNGNLTATNPTAVSNDMTMGTIGVNPTGSSFRYFEMTVNTGAGTTAPTISIGLAGAGTSTASGVGLNSTSIGYAASGSVFFNSSGLSGPPTYTTGDVIGVLLTPDTVYFTKNGQVVAVDTRLPSGMLYPAVSFGNSTEQVTANFGASAFSNWPNVSDSWDQAQHFYPTEWDISSKSASVTLRNNNTTCTSTGVNNQGARTVTSRNSGIVAYDMRIDAGQPSFGIISPSTNPSSTAGGKAFIVYQNASQVRIFSNTSVTDVSLITGTIAVGDVWTIIVDIGNLKLYTLKNGAAFAGNFPARTGGVSIDAGQIWYAWWKSQNHSPDTSTAFFSALSYPQSGASAWDAIPQQASFALPRNKTYIRR
jgi:hypothetical protein